VTVTHTSLVLFGGRSDERHVSVATAQNIVRTLDRCIAWFEAPDGSIHDVAAQDLLAHERPFENDFLPARPAIFPTLEQALDTMPVENPVVVVAYHGGDGENGTVQRMLEHRDLPFTGSGSAASAAAFAKDRAKELVRGRVPVAESRVASGHEELVQAIDALSGAFERLVLKPVAGGSSRGLYFFDRGASSQALAGEIAASGVPYVIEQFLAGRELTVGVVDRGNGPVALPVIEIELDADRRFDYAGKYLGAGSREICPAKIPATLAREAQAAALEAHLALGCYGYSRSDLIATPDGVFFLELNTLPGLTNRSLVPQELAEEGIAFRSFLETQIALALRR
jgi:D-alanine-D-alanine ligase